MKLGTLFMLIKVLIKVIKKNLSMSVEFTVSPFCGDKPFYSKFVSVVTKMLTSWPVFRYYCGIDWHIEWNNKVNIAQCIVIKDMINCILFCHTHGFL